MTARLSPAQQRIVDAMREDRFWAKVDRTDDSDACWEWGGYCRRGYGQFRVGGCLVSAHRFAWEATHGPIPDGLVVCHRCDNPPCCNPAHLFLGTQAENLRDRDAKGRRRLSPARGEDCRHAKLTTADVLEIRASNEARTVLARRYGVTRSTVYDIRSGRSWRHLLTAYRGGEA